MTAPYSRLTVARLQGYAERSGPAHRVTAPARSAPPPPGTPAGARLKAQISPVSLSGLTGGPLSLVPAPITTVSPATAAPEEMGAPSGKAQSSEPVAAS